MMRFISCSNKITLRSFWCWICRRSSNCCSDKLNTKICWRRRSCCNTWWWISTLQVSKRPWMFTFGFKNSRQIWSKSMAAVIRELVTGIELPMKSCRFSWSNWWSILSSNTNPKTNFIRKMPTNLPNSLASLPTNSSINQKEFTSSLTASWPRSHFTSRIMKVNCKRIW